MEILFTLYNTKRRKQMINANDRLHWAKKSRITKFLRATACQKAQQKKFKKYTVERQCICIVHIYGANGRKFDPHNFYPTVKAMIDGFTDAKVWEDDNHTILTDVQIRYGGKSEVKGAYQMLYEILEVENEKI